jgi:hypothetical protein
MLSEKNEKPDQGSVSGIIGNLTTGHKKKSASMRIFHKGYVYSKKINTCYHDIRSELKYIKLLAISFDCICTICKYLVQHLRQ